MIPTRKKEVEQFAMQILAKYSIHDNPGKHLNKIIDGESISLIDYHEWTEEICGRFLYIDDEPAIFYNAKHTAPMQAFTIAHELGHYFLRHLDGTEAEIICIDRDFNRLGSNDDASEKEVEANYFAFCKCTASRVRGCWCGRDCETLPGYAKTGKSFAKACA